MKAFNLVAASFLLALGFSMSAWASDFAALIGARSNSADAVPATATSSSMTGLGAGVMGFFDMTPQLQGRIGLVYNQRNTKLGFTGGDLELTANYLDIPLTAMYKFADYGGAFAGPVVGFGAGKSCKDTGSATCAGLKDPESAIFGFQFGASFKFASQLGAEIYYEVIPSEYWKDTVKSMKTVGANLLFTFE